MTHLTSKVFVDANILLEIIHERQQFDMAIDFLRTHAGRIAISPLTVHLVMYFGRSVASVQSLKQLLSDFVTLPLADAEVQWAFNNGRDHDFEDALQLACAVHGDCTQFVTFDHKLAQRYQTLPNISVRLLE